MSDMPDLSNLSNWAPRRNAAIQRDILPYQGDQDLEVRRGVVCDPRREDDAEEACAGAIYMYDVRCVMSDAKCKSKI